MDRELDALHARAERIIAALTDLYGQLDDLKRQIRAHQQRHPAGGRYREAADQHRVSRR